MEYPDTPLVKYSGDLQQDLFDTIINELCTGLQIKKNRTGLDYIEDDRLVDSSYIDEFFVNLMCLQFCEVTNEQKYGICKWLINHIRENPDDTSDNDALIKLIKHLKHTYIPKRQARRRIPPPSLRPRDPNNPADRKYFLDDPPRPRIPPPSLRPRDPNNPADRKYFLDPLPQRPRQILKEIIKDNQELLEIKEF